MNTGSVDTDRMIASMKEFRSIEAKFHAFERVVHDNANRVLAKAVWNRWSVSLPCVVDWESEDDGGHPETILIRSEWYHFLSMPRLIYIFKTKSGKWRKSISSTQTKSFDFSDILDCTSNGRNATKDEIDHVSVVDKRSSWR